MQPPKDIKAKSSEHVLEITWADGSVTRMPNKWLRGECACAGCVDEMTGMRTLDVAAIDENITIQQMAAVGNYAIKILWSDGHDTGLYTWERLRQLAAEVDTP